MSHGPLRRALHEAAHALPAQGPIEVFIHHNTLHAFQGLPFHAAIAKAEDELGAQGYLAEQEFRQAYHSGRITADDLAWALERFAPATPEQLPVDARALQRALLLSAPGPMGRDTLELLKHEGRWACRLDETLDAETRAVLISETGRWLDEALRQGPSLLPFAHRLVGPRVDLVAASLRARGVSGAEAETEAVRRALAPLGLAPTRDFLVRALAGRTEALAAFALWGACAEACGGAEALAPAPGDPVERETARLANDWLVPWCASYVDRGVARWVMPRRQAGFFDAFRALHAAPGEVLPAWLEGLGALLRDSEARGEDAEAFVARRLGPLGPQTVPALERLLLRLPGWAGMFQRLEQFPVPELPRVRLLDYVAVRLAVDDFAQAAAVHRLEGVETARPVLVRDALLALYAGAQRLGLSAREVSQLAPGPRAALVEAVDTFGRRARAVVWQEAYERHHELEVVGAVLAHRPPTAPPPTMQAVFCIDDREESFRRHLEEVQPSVRTFGIAGFFGIAVEFLPLDDVATATQAPLGLVPAHAVHEAPHPAEAERAALRRARQGRLARLTASWRRATGGVAGGGLASFFAGPVVLLELAARVLAPLTTERALEAVRRAVVPEVRTVLSEPRQAEAGRTVEGRHVGFTFEEKAERVAETLENIGLTTGFAPLVVLVAHGSSSLNNPHRSAYDCGACGGRNGGPNARLFARMANRPQVREVLRARGIDLPAETHVLGAVHDTATDALHFYDEDAVPEALRPQVERARAAFAEVSRRSAHERCRKFVSAPSHASPEQALRHVQSRAVDVSQARPELGHATNAVCMVGRRALTRGLFLDRRAFLVSYDPGADEGGAVLERIMAAAGPVGAGINLEYYFSRVDNEQLGCGTKLPHNLVSHVGVMNGAASDLRTGLPRQMIEIHEPVRLLFVIEAEVATLEGVLARQPQVQALAAGGWVRVVSLSPSGAGTKVLRGGRFEPWEGPWVTLPKVACSRDWYEGHEGFRPPAVVDPGQGAARVA